LLAVPNGKVHIKFLPLKMKTFLKQEKLSFFRSVRKSPSPSQDFVSPRPLHTPPPTEIARFPRPDPILEAPREPQIIQDRYIDGDKLLAICQERYGVENCRLKVISSFPPVSDISLMPSQYKNERYYLQAPEVIGEVCHSDYARLLLLLKLFMTNFCTGHSYAMRNISQ